MVVLHIIIHVVNLDLVIRLLLVVWYEIERYVWYIHMVYGRWWWWWWYVVCRWFPFFGPYIFHYFLH